MLEFVADSVADVRRQASTAESHWSIPTTHTMHTDRRPATDPLGAGWCGSGAGCNATLAPNGAVALTGMLRQHASLDGDSTPQSAPPGHALPAEGRALAERQQWLEGG
eukprot:gene32876-8268_t